MDRQEADGGMAALCTLFQHDSSTWESVSCWATSLDHRGQKGPGTGCFSRAITGPDSDPTARHLKPLPWCPVEAMVSDSEKATERSQGLFSFLWEVTAVCPLTSCSSYQQSRKGQHCLH